MFPAYPEAEPVFLPARPVPVGHKWQAPSDAADKWGWPKGSRILSSEHSLVSVADGIARVRNDLSVRYGKVGDRWTTQKAFTAEIDTKTGRWVARSGSSTYDVKRAHVMSKGVFRWRDESTFTRGTGKASRLPKGLVKIGWERPGKDTNRYQRPELGFSLEPPEGFAEQWVRPGSGPRAANWPVHMGASVPADGEIEEGESDLNEAMITGESKPVEKSPGDELIAGTINGDGSLRVRVTATGEETALAGIMRLVEEAQQSKSETQLLADKAAGWLFYIAVSVAAVTAVAWIVAVGFDVDVIARVATVLVIACPMRWDWPSRWW